MKLNFKIYATIVLILLINICSITCITKKTQSFLRKQDNDSEGI